jgi:tRNA A37 methylthiotransferase MiaB
MKFVRGYEFDSVALFEYHNEPLAPSSKLKDSVSHDISLKRINDLDKLINSIYLKKEKKLK